MYFPSFKWNRYFLQELPLIPGSFVERIDALFENPPMKSVEIYEGLVGDLFGLIESHLPEIESRKARDRFYERTPIWRQPPNNAVEDNSG